MLYSSVYDLIALIGRKAPFSLSPTHKKCVGEISSLFQEISHKRIINTAGMSDNKRMLDICKVYFSSEHVSRVKLRSVFTPAAGFLLLAHRITPACLLTGALSACSQESYLLLQYIKHLCLYHTSPFAFIHGTSSYRPSQGSRHHDCRRPF